ncbi:MAG: phosphomannomutase/phosphoglucomutase [Christensenella sp.]
MSIYKDCDIRGIYGEELREAEAYEIGRAIGSILQGKKVLLCGDARFSTDSLKEKMAEGLTESGADIIDIGIEPTPVFYYAKSVLKTDGGVMVTASHNPWQYNGFKVVLGDRPITTEDIREIESIVAKKSYTVGKGSVETLSMERRYADFIRSVIKCGNKKAVVDAGGGVMGKVAPDLFREMGYDVVELFCELDGRFTNRDPNPAVYSHLTKLQEAVVKNHADYGVAFDGDGDRAVFVSDTGEVITSERSLCIFMKYMMHGKGDSVVYDLKSSSIIKKTAEELGVEPIMERSGHAFIKKTFLAHESSLAGEISGHFFFKELGHDDGLFAALKMGEILSKSTKKLSALAADIPMTVITPDIRIKWSYDTQDALIAHVKELGKRYKMLLLDGVRIGFDKGWLLIRKSVTEEGITLRIEAEAKSDMQDIVNILIENVPELEGKNELLIKA